MRRAHVTCVIPWRSCAEFLCAMVLLSELPPRTDDGLLLAPTRTRAFYARNAREQRVATCRNEAIVYSMRVAHAVASPRTGRGHSGGPSQWSWSRVRCPEWRTPRPGGPYRSYQQHRRIGSCTSRAPFRPMVVARSLRGLLEGRHRPGGMDRCSTGPMRTMRKEAQ